MRTKAAALEYPGQPWINPALVSIARAATPRRKPHGELIAAFEVTGEPVPWRAPLQGKGMTFTPKHARAWKQQVAEAAHRAGFGEGAGFAAYPFAVSIDVWFCRKCPKGRKPGDTWETTPDFDNLAKGFTDSITGNVFKVSRPQLDEAGRPVTGKGGKPARVSARFCPPQPTGRIIEDDRRVVEAFIYKNYWTRSLAYAQVRAVDSRPPEDEIHFPFAL